MNENNNEVNKLILLKTKQGHYCLNIADILSIETINKNCYIYSRKKTIIVNRKPLATQIAELNHPYIIRCHKSFAINVSNLIEIRKQRRNIWKPVFSSDAKANCEISRTYHNAVLTLYMEFLENQFKHIN